MKSLFNRAAVARYRGAAIELHELRIDVGQRIEAAIQSGEKVAARDALAELKASGEQLQKLKATLTARDLFVAKYNIQVHGRHEVSFVLPKGASRYEMLREAQGLGLRDNLDLVFPEQLEEWQSDRRFTDKCTTPEYIRIDGHVRGGDGKDRATQEDLVQKKGQTLPFLEDLAAAFVAHYAATGQPLFQWFSKANQWSFVVRVAGGALGFDCRGLCLRDTPRDAGGSQIAVAARVPPTSPGLRRTSRN